MSMIARIRSIGNVLIKYLQNFNIYTEAYEDSQEIRGEHIIATRVFLVLLCTTMIALTAYTMLSQHAFTITVIKPSQADYEYLQAKYSNILECPCSQASIPLGSFITIKHTFHQVCL